MDAETRTKIERLLSFLSTDQREKAIIEISENDKVIFDFLESQGNLHISYSVQNNKPILPAEIEGNVHLWNKKLNGNWTVNLYQIDKIIKANWKEE
jgi:hypothetical protein